MPFATALIFLVHPIQTQAVTYISQRFTSLATLFYLLALVLYVKARVKSGSNRSLDLLPNTAKAVFLPSAFSLYLLSLLSAILAMKTKEISFTLPFIIILYEFTFFRNNDSQLLSASQPRQAGTTLKSRLLYLVPFVLTLFVIPLTLGVGSTDMFTASSDVSEVTKKGLLRDIKDIPVYNYFITQFRVIGTYIRLLFFPINQNLLHDYPWSKSIFEPSTFLSFLFIFVSSVYLYIRSRKTINSYGLLISFGILWFFITLSVESSIIPIRDVIFEHRVYLPSVGFILSVTTIIFYSFEYLQERTGKQIFKYLLAVITAITLIFTISTYKRNIL